MTRTVSASCLLAALFLCGCPANPCERAADLATSCGYNKPPDSTSVSSSSATSGDPPAAIVRDCNVVAECESSCFLNAKSSTAGHSDCDVRMMVEYDPTTADGKALKADEAAYQACLSACPAR